ncbi:carbamoyl-phosphate synthase [Citricoccus sp.]|uniref:carboxylate--amine ligase n=1 Tax=Citricoccus sp. TaxID=1978372 RepID=UPI002614334A|nr:carbamoyl-phosphate synthase [Citricoccus sp.]HRO31680.1 carbamoyl-phosphate synthase [Citricoccus sp.]
MMVPAEQSFVPVITGGDVGAYSLAREFHEAYGVVSAVVPTAVNRNLRHSRILEAFPAGPMTEEGPVLEALLAVADALNGRVPGRPLLLLASYDHLVRFAARHRDTLEARGYTVPYPDEGALDAAALKENFYALCDRFGVPYPRTAAYDAGSHTPAALAGFLAGLGEDGPAFPVILKAGDGGAWADVRFTGRRKVHVVHGAEELGELIGRASGAGYRGSLIVQELVPGPDSQLGIATFFRDGTGTTRLVSYGEVIVEDHAPGTEGNARAVLAGEHETVARQGTALLEALDWRGFAMFDIKVDPRDERAQFLEMNPRLGRNHYYLTGAGANPAPYLLAEYLPEVADAVGGPAPAAGQVTTDGPVLTTTVPMSLVRRYASAGQREAIRRAARAGRVVRPFEYRADADPRRLAGLRLAELNSLRVFRQYPPQS